MKEYLNAQNKMNESIIENVFSSDELHRFSKSDFRWAENRKKKLRQKPVKKGEIYQFEFGKNYIPEMSYEHQGLVIGVKQKLLYVLPIFSYDPLKHLDVYHPVDYPESHSDLFLLKSSEFSNDIRTVSINRILYQQSGRIPPDSDTYKQIETLTIQKYFPTFYYSYKQNLQTIQTLSEQLQKANMDKENLQSENEQLKAEIASIKEQREN